MDYIVKIIIDLLVRYFFPYLFRSPISKEEQGIMRKSCEVLQDFMNRVSQHATVTQEMSRMLNPVLNELQMRFSKKIPGVVKYVQKIDLLSLHACIWDQVLKETNSTKGRIEAYHELRPHITEIRNLPNPLKIFGPYMQGMNRIQLIGLWMRRTFKNRHIWLKKWINVTRIDLRIEERQ